MKLIFTILIAVLCITCTDNDDKIADNVLTGKWKLSEILLDPGNGSGTFHSVISSKITEFHSDGTITSNGSLCMASGEINSPGSGSYSLADSTIFSPECASGLPLKITFRMAASSLIISYPCDEPCREKYTKIQK